MRRLRRKLSKVLSSFVVCLFIFNSLSPLLGGAVFAGEADLDGVVANSEVVEVPGEVEEPPVVVPPVDEPPIIEPPVEEPPVVEPPVVDPPVEEPPVIEPPVEEEAVVEKPFKDEIVEEKELSAEIQSPGPPIISNPDRGEKANHSDDILNIDVMIESEDVTVNVVSATYEIIGTGISGALSDTSMGPAGTCEVNGQTEGGFGSPCVRASANVNIYSLQDGAYDIRICGTNNNAETGFGDWWTLPTGQEADPSTHYCYRYTIDVDRPTANDLPNKTFNEGDSYHIYIAGNGDFPLYITMDMRVPETSGWKRILTDEAASSGGVFIDEDVVFDTSVINEGTYEFRYFVKEPNMSGADVWVSNSGYSNLDNVFEGKHPNGGDINGYYFKWELKNVSPEVRFGNNQTIRVGQTANFSGSFSDPSYMSSSPNDPDDAPWTVSVQYYSGGPWYALPDKSHPGTINVPSRTYSNPGVYTATLKVCEADKSVNPKSEGTCGTKSVTVNVTSDTKPTVYIWAAPGTNVDEGTQVILYTNVYGGDHPLSYIWWGDCSGYGASNSTLPTTAGTYMCGVTVYDRDGDSSSASVYVIVNAKDDTEDDFEDEGLVVEVQAGDKDTSEVLGEQICEVKQIVSGYVFFDENGNGKYDDGEEVLKDVRIEIYYIDKDGDKVVIARESTDRNGYWEAQACPGRYKARLVLDDLPGDVIPANREVISIEVVAEEDLDQVNFIVKIQEAGTSLLSFWWIIPVLALLALLLGFYLWKRSQSDQEDKMTKQVVPPSVSAKTAVRKTTSGKGRRRKR